MIRIENQVSLNPRNSRQSSKLLVTTQYCTRPDYPFTLAFPFPTVSSNTCDIELFGLDRPHLQ